MKRPRVMQVSAKRPIDKALINVTQTVTSSQTSTTLTTATFPCTLTGLRWSCSLSGNATAGTAVYWAIIRLQDGLAASTLATSDGSDLYTPEQEVLAFGVAQLADSDGGTGSATYNFDGSTKTMRKLMGGDSIRLITLSTTAAGAALRGTVQFFCKS